MRTQEEKDVAAAKAGYYKSVEGADDPDVGVIYHWEDESPTVKTLWLDIVQAIKKELAKD